MTKYRFYILFLIFICIYSARANADVFVSSKLGIILPPVSDTISAGQMKWYPLSSQSDGVYKAEKLEITVAVNSTFPDIGAYVCDESNLQKLINNQPFRCFGETKGYNTFTIEAERYSDQTHYLVFNNRYSLFTDKSIGTHIYVETEATDEYRQQFKTAIEDLLLGIHKTFNAPEFDINIAPCRTKNAFSTVKGGHITLCSELIFGTMLENNQGAFLSVLLHELGHTLLNLWGEPHYTNEKTADEFAIAFLLMIPDNKGEAAIHDWIAWFKDNQYLEGEISAMLSGDQHPLTAQRVAAIEQILLSRGDFQRRWANALYPHMTDKVLNEIISNPYDGANIKFAQEILSKRETQKN